MSANRGPIWVRSPNGWVAGICRGLAESLNMPVGFMRILWILFVLCIGTGLGVYLLLWVALPRTDLWLEAQSGRVLGVCTRLAHKMNMEIGLVRFLFLLSLFLSAGVTLVVYIMLHFLLDSKSAPV